MRRGFYKHIRALDCYILVLKVQYACQRYSKLKIEWFVRGHSLFIKQTIKIERSDFQDWKPFEWSDLPVKRGPAGSAHGRH